MFAKLVAVSLLTLASSQLMAAECKTTIDSTDQMSFNTKAIARSRVCDRSHPATRFDCCVKIATPANTRAIRATE